jgi:hypothetical protein
VPGGAACTTTAATTCTITGLTDGTTYNVSVVAHTTVGDSGASAPARVTPRAPGAPTGPIVSLYRNTKCVDDSDGSARNGTPVVIWHCNGSRQQDWTIEPDGTVRINGKCMGIPNGGKGNWAEVELWTCGNGASERWRATTSATLVNLKSHKCLAYPRSHVHDGTRLRMQFCNGRANQQWKLP